MKIRFKKLVPKAVIPFKKYDVDAGFDMTAIWKKETDQYTEYGTGIALEIPNGYVGLMFPRSSVRNMDFTLKNSVGVIDASYRGEIKFSYLNAVHDLFQKNFYSHFTDENNYVVNDEYITIKKQILRNPQRYDVGDRVGQIVFVKIPDIQMVETKELNETKRGTAGYGSSGK